MLLTPYQIILLYDKYVEKQEKTCFVKKVIYLSIKTMSNQRRVPINRVNKFFSAEDYRLDVEMGREGIEGDNNFSVILYKVDRENTSSDDVYGEAGKDEIRYFPPVELVVMPTFEEAENKTYNSNGSLRYLETGNLVFSIYVAQLEEHQKDIDVGDYIGYPVSPTEMIYFNVSNDGRKNWDNKHTILGFRGAYRTITCTPVDESEFRSF